MALTYWIVDRGNDVYGIEPRNHRPSNAVAIAPLDNGQQVTDIDWLDVLDVDMGQGTIIKQGVVNPTKKQAKLDALQAVEGARAAAEAARKAVADGLRAKGPADLTTLPEIRDTIIEILDYLGLR